MNSENGRINGLLAHNDSNASPGGGMHDLAHSETRDVSIQIDELNPARAHPAAASNDNAAPLHQTTAQTHPLRNAKGISHTLLKPLIAIATAQYVIVTVLAGLAAITVASTAGKAINAKFELIIAALKRF